MHDQTCAPLFRSLWESVGPPCKMVKPLNARVRMLWVTACLIAIGLGAWRLFGSGEEPDTADLVPVLAAEHYIPAFTVLKKEDITIHHMPKSYVPPGAFYT